MAVSILSERTDRTDQSTITRNSHLHR